MKHLSIVGVAVLLLFANSAAGDVIENQVQNDTSRTQAGRCKSCLGFCFN
jgi:hypothetical protein